MEYNVKAKVNEKYHQFGKIKQGKYGPQLSFRNTPELKQFIMNSGDWVNFNLFEPKDPEKPTVSPDTQAQLDKLKQDALNSEIPF